MMPATALSGGSGGPPISETMLAYLGYGFSILPIAPGTKKPHLLLTNNEWRTFQQRQATPEEVQRWVDQAPNTGVGIVCGEISGNLYCLDVDDQGFAAWIEANMAHTGHLWIVRSGSGLLHIYTRSQTKVFTTHIVGAIGGTSQKLADVRGDGHGRAGPSYMVAPPTVHPSGRPYETLYGDPEHIGTCSDAFALFSILRDKYLGSAPIVVSSRDDDVDEAQMDTGNKSIMAKPDDTRWKQILNRVQSAQISRKVRKAIIEGALAHEGMWSGADSNSEIDHRIVKELREQNWNVEDIETVFAGSPVGANCYRNTSRPNHGHGYLMQSLVKIDKARAQAEAAAQSASGHNFTVLGVVRVGWGDPIYEVTFSWEGQRGMARLKTEQLMDSYRFQTQVARELNFLPLFDRALEGHRFARFGALVMAMSGQEEVPMSATEQGHLRGVTLQIINQEIDPQEPEDERMMRLGWRNGSLAYVRGAAVLRHLQTVIRPSPKPEKVWEVLRAMGGQEESHRWVSGRKEALWTVPIQKLEE